jgi:hypothetical protein
MTVQKTLTAGLILGLGLLFGGVSTFAQGSAELFAKTTAQWWQFVISLPTTVNPLVDSTGADCMVGQRGPVWFLAGTFFGGTATRTCSIPEGEALFFPVINSVQVNSPNVCGQTGNLGVNALRALAAPLIDAATNLSVQVDGKVVEELVRIRSVVFAATFPTDNIFNAPCGGPGTVPAGVYSPAVDDGFYASLKPLSVGSHTLHIHAEVPSQNFVLDVTYDLRVVPVQLDD